MKKILFFLLVFSYCFGYSQVIPLTNSEAQKQVYTYVMENLTELKKEIGKFGANGVI